ASARCAKLPSHKAPTYHDNGTAIAKARSIRSEHSRASRATNPKLGAPFTFRIPISFRRLSAVYDDNPNNPKQAINTARIEKYWMVFPNLSSFRYRLSKFSSTKA